MTSPTVEGIKKDIERKKKLIAKHKQELDNMVSVLKSICTHENTETIERFYDGTYLDGSYTEYKVMCKDCGTHLGTTTQEHSYYG